MIDISVKTSIIRINAVLISALVRFVLMIFSIFMNRLVIFAQIMVRI